VTAEPRAADKVKGEASSMRAVILAGGKGSRLLPFTSSCPKPLVPLGDSPIMDVLIHRLINFGITNITLTLGHSAELIKSHLNRQKHLFDEIKLSYVEEEKPTGTAGSLSLIPDLDETFLAMNSDLLTNIDFHALIQCHRKNKALLTIATNSRRIKVDLGVLEFDEDHQITNYIEKPETSYHISMGIYVYDPGVLKYIDRGQYLDFPDLVLRLLEKGERVCAYPTDCMWLDIGRPDDYAKAQELFRDQKEAFEFV
jgi:NDP-sugar pyrophosphorylase family protein